MTNQENIFEASNKRFLPAMYKELLKLTNKKTITPTDTDGGY